RISTACCWRSERHRSDAGIPLPGIPGPREPFASFSCRQRYARADPHPMSQEPSMNTESLTASLFQHLQQGPALQQVSQQLGVDSSQASKAIQTALPLLMGAMGNNASSPQVAQSLLNALQRD